MDGNETGGTDASGTNAVPSDEPPDRSPLTPDAVADAADRTSSVRNADLVVPDDASLPARVSSVLVAIAGGPHSGATVDLAATLAIEEDAWIELFHVATEGERETGADDDRGNRLVAAAADRLDGLERVDEWVVAGDAPAEAIVEQSAYYDAVIIGASTTGAVERFVFGSTTETVLSDAVGPVIVVESDSPTPVRGSPGETRRAE